MTEASELINRSNTICHYTRFSGFSEPNCNGCNVGVPKMGELLHLFAENGISSGWGPGGLEFALRPRGRCPVPQSVWTRSS